MIIILPGLQLMKLLKSMICLLVLFLISKNKFPALDFKDPEVAPIDSLILINETDFERIVFLMKEYNIKYRIPVEFNLDLKFNSKINN